MTGGRINSTAHWAQLTALANALGLQVKDFFVDPPPGELGEAITMIRLWSAISDAQGRRRVLNLMRQEAERSGNNK